MIPVSARGRERSPISFFLTEGLVAKDRAVDAFAQTGRGDNEFPISAAGLFGLGNSKTGESFVAGVYAFIHRQQTFIPGNQCFGGID
jgi:hypothetical protein